jgi:hypothetical protein
VQSDWLGHARIFSRLNKETATVQFSDHAFASRELPTLLAPLGMLALFERRMAEMDDLIAQLADLQHRLAPVPGLEDG